MSNPSNNSQQETPVNKGIGSLAQTPNPATTRGGAKKLKFTPTLPPRRTSKPDIDTNVKVNKKETSHSTNTRGRGGRGADRSNIPTRDHVQMTASGPFAMGPSAVSGTSSSRSALRTGTAIVPPSGPNNKVASELTNAPAPQLRSIKKDCKDEEDSFRELYSDPEEEGLEIIDMNLVKDMDWNAPDILTRVAKLETGAEYKQRELKLEPETGHQQQDPFDLGGHREGHEAEDLHEYFDQQLLEVDSNTTQPRKLYFFQFPTPFPTFQEKELPTNTADEDQTRQKHVSFAADTKPITNQSDEGRETEPVNAAGPTKRLLSGQIGQLQVYESGAVRIRLNNGLLYDAMAAMPSSFLQQVLCIDPSQSRMTALGEIDQRFMISPNVEQLLESAESLRVDKADEMDVDA